MIWALEVGGAERFFIKLLKNLPQSQFDIKVVCLSRKGVWANEVESCGIPIVSMDKKTGIDFFILFRLITLIRHEKPDIVNLYLWTAYLWGGLASRIVGVKHVIVTEQNLDVWKRWYHKLIDKFLMRWMDRVICVSDQVADFYQKQIGVPGEKIHMIPNAIDLSLFSPHVKPTGFRNDLRLKEDCFLFVCAARLHPQKAHHVLIEAVGILKRREFENFHLIIVGEGELRAHYEADVKKRKLENSISFLGLRQDIPEILIQSDCFVLSSDYEGLPLAILEAMAAGKPVVATEVGGNAQVVKTGQNGILVPSRHPELLADAMQKLLINRNLAQEMGRNGKTFIEENFAIDKIAKQTIDLFYKCMEQD